MQKENKKEEAIVINSGPSAPAKKSNLALILIIVGIFVILILLIAILIAAFFLLQSKAAERNLEVDGNIQQAIVYNESICMLSLVDAINISNIKSLKFVFENSSYITSEFKKDYEINNSDLEIENFKAIKKVSAEIEYYPPIIPSINNSWNGTGNETEPPPGQRPCTAKTCSNYPGQCGIFDDNCNGTTICVCETGKICNSTKQCITPPSCTSDNNCTSFTGVCGTGKCNSSGECYVSYLTGNICKNNLTECDAVETCQDGLAACPNDINKTDGTACTGGTCQNGICTVCAPSCTGKQCGSNGCGGTCSPGCSSGYNCNSSGQCEVSTIQKTSSITQNGITWTFDKEYQYGQFVNGDYWVLGPVVITRITPDQTNGINGWMVNALNPGSQSFDSRYFSYNSALMPSLPYAASGTKSLIKALSVPYVTGGWSDCEAWNKICIINVSILTVVDSVPATDSFRPAFAGSNKEFFYARNLKTNMLPSLSSVSTKPSKDEIIQRIAMSRLDYGSSSMSQGMFNPYNSVYPPGRTWGAEMSNANAEVLFWLALDDSLNNKFPVLYKFVQEGIDLYGARKIGTSWVMGGGGNGEGRLIPIAFAAAILGSNEIKSTLQSSVFNQEYDNTFWESEMYKTTVNGQAVVWGQHSKYGDYELNYWKAAGFNEGYDRTARDPYGYIDGISTYQVLTALPTKYEALTLILYPDMLNLVSTEGNELIKYADRWTIHGRWMQPDSCAPVMGTCKGGANDGKSCIIAHSDPCPSGSCWTGACESGSPYAGQVCTKGAGPGECYGGYGDCCGTHIMWGSTVAWGCNPNPAYYGITYGPNGTGGCIKDLDSGDGIGRFPLNDGNCINSDCTSASRKTAFGEEMWNTYRHCYNNIQDSGETGVDCGGTCNATGQCEVSNVQKTSSITQYGITWTFDKEYQYGQFVNGDYWVLGPVVITSITPDYAGGRNGWEVNPSHTDRHGFDDRTTATFDSSLIPSLPYTANSGSSIIKTISVTDGNTKTYIQTAAVLTVLGEVPPNNGTTVFRPPYFGSSKPLYSASNIRLDLLPSLAPVADAPTLSATEAKFRGVHISHIPDWTGAQIRPVDSYDLENPYGAEVATDAANSVLRLMLNDAPEAKRPAALYITQAGIDYYHMALGGESWSANGGHGNGIKLPMTFAAVMLDNTEMKNYVSSASKDGMNHKFGEDGMIYLGRNGVILFGEINPWCGESWYWSDIVSDSMGTCRDPYGIIDGGHKPTVRDYQTCCNSMPWKYTALTLLIMPQLNQTWNNARLIEYSDRWVNHGFLAQPDPCAPLSQGGGPDPAHPGQCILDPDLTPGSTFTSFSCQAGKQCGRFPESEGSNKDSGYYASNFGTAMWSTYRHCFNGVQDGSETGVDCGGTCRACSLLSSPIEKESLFTKIIKAIREFFS